MRRARWKTDLDAIFVAAAAMTAVVTAADEERAEVEVAAEAGNSLRTFSKRPLLGSFALVLSTQYQGALGEYHS